MLAVVFMVLVVLHLVLLVLFVLLVKLGIGTFGVLRHETELVDWRFRRTIL